VLHRRVTGGDVVTFRAVFPLSWGFRDFFVTLRQNGFFMAKKAKVNRDDDDEIEFYRRPKWEVELERDGCPYIASMARQGRLSRFIYGLAAGVKEADCWDYNVLWPAKSEIGAMAMHPVVGPMLERAWLSSKRDELVLGLRIAAENGNRDAASALAEWMTRGAIRQSAEDLDLPGAGFKIAKEGF